MSSPVATQLWQTWLDEMNREAGASGYTASPGALCFLLQPDPEAIIEVELVDRPLDLRQDQFEALLADSECEV